MGLLTYCLLSRDISQVETYILYLENRINILEDQMKKMLKWANFVDSEFENDKDGSYRPKID